MKRLILVMFFLLLLIQCVETNQGYDYSAADKSAMDILTDRANQYHDEMVERGLIYQDSLSREFLREVATSIADTMLPQAPMQFYVLRNPVVNAAALPNGNTYFTVGLLVRMDTPDQIAFIIAHELAHVKLNHSLLKYEQRKRSMATANVFDVLLLGIGLSYIPAAASQAQFSRNQELQADSLAMAVLYQLNYPITSVPAVFYIFDQVSPAAQVTGSLYQSHPTNKERQQRIAQYVRNLDRGETFAPEIIEKYNRLHLHLYEEYVQMTLLRKDYSLAQDVIRQALTRNTAIPRYHYYAGELYREQATNPDIAAKDYVRYHETADLENVKMRYADSVQVWFQHARSEYSQALFIDPTFVLGYRGLGLVAYQQNQYEKGIEYLSKYMDEGQSVPDRRYLLYLVKQMEEEL